MPEVKEKKDWVPAVAVTLGVTGVGAGLYFWMKKPPKEVKEGEWAGSGVILARKTFQVTITTEEVIGWQLANVELARQSFQVTIQEPTVGDWFPANTELARQSFQVTIREPEVGVWLPANVELARALFSVNIGATLTVSVAVPAVGWVYISPDKPVYGYGETVTLTAYLDNWAFGYYKFSYWKINGETKTANPISVIMNKDINVIAYFTTI